MFRVYHNAELSCARLQSPNLLHCLNLHHRVFLLTESLRQTPRSPKNRWQASCLNTARQQFENVSVAALVVGLLPCWCPMPQQLRSTAAPQRVNQTARRGYYVPRQTINQNILLLTQQWVAISFM